MPVWWRRGFEPLTFSLRRLGSAEPRACPSCIDCLAGAGLPIGRGATNRGCAGGARFGGHGRATDPITSPGVRRCPGSRVAGGHRGATLCALDAGRRRADDPGSGRRLAVSGVPAAGPGRCSWGHSVGWRGAFLSCPHEHGGVRVGTGRQPACPERGAPPRAARRGRRPLEPCKESRHEPAATVR